MRVLRLLDGSLARADSGRSQQTLTEPRCRLLRAHAATPLRRDRVQAPVGSRQPSGNGRGGIRVVPVPIGALDGLTVRGAGGKGFPGGPEGIDDVRASRTLRMPADRLQFGFYARRQMAGGTDQRLRQSLGAPGFPAHEDLDDAAVEGADRLGAWVSVRKLGAPAGLHDQAFRVGAVANQRTEESRV